MSARRFWTLNDLPGPVFQTMGRIVFDPVRPGMKRRTQNWVVIEIDREITAYYRWMFRKNWFEIDRGGRRRPIYQPSWDAHLSVVRGEVARWLRPDEVRAGWDVARDRFNGRRLPVFYSNLIRQTGDTTAGDRPDHFWFIPAFSECVSEIRQMLALPISDRQTGRPYSSHITIGRTYTD
jgi:hypothetical protein